MQRGLPKHMAVNYEELAEQYNRFRTPDPRIASAIWAHLGDAENVLNVGAGIGSYEPVNCRVVAVEPSEKMIALRPISGAKVIRGSAENLPFYDDTFDASLALLTIHHWSDIRMGLNEMLRVTRGNIILLTWIGYGMDFWVEEYIPEIRGVDIALFPTLGDLERMIGSIIVEPVDIPFDCADGFMCAYWRRPKAYLDPDVRKAISTFSRVGDIRKSLQHLEDDLSNGTWDKRYGHLLLKESMDLGYRVVVRNKENAKPGA
jgi:SAM-dependent methyltransferase